MEAAAYDQEDLLRIDSLCEEICKIVTLNQPTADAVANAITVERIHRICQQITPLVNTPFATRKVQELRALVSQGYGTRANAYSGIAGTIRVLAHGVSTAARDGR